MKKKLCIAGLIILLAVILCFPIKLQFMDGGTTFYSALAYRVVVWRVLSLNPSGDESRLTGRDVYFFPRNFREYEYYFEQRFGTRPGENSDESASSENVLVLREQRAEELKAELAHKGWSNIAVSSAEDEAQTYTVTGQTAGQYNNPITITVRIAFYDGSTQGRQSITYSSAAGRDMDSDKLLAADDPDLWDYMYSY